MPFARWSRFFKRRVSQEDMLRKVIEEGRITVRELEGHRARGYREYRYNDIVRIMLSPHYPSLVDGFGTVAEAHPRWIMVHRIRTRYEYRHGRLAFRPDQLKLVSNGINE